jgi:hypothetical protein
MISTYMSQDEIRARIISEEILAPTMHIFRADSERRIAVSNRHQGPGTRDKSRIIATAGWG